MGRFADMQSASTYTHSLPVPGETSGLEHFGMENVLEDVRDAYRGDESERGDDLVKSTKDSIKAAQEVSNLSVGKLLEVEVESDGAKAVFPVSVRLITTAAPRKAWFIPYRLANATPE